MQFKHPEILYALLLLIIPIIVHLFQLQRFVKIPFTNVKFLRNIEQQTRKSARLKKWLILATRFLAFLCLIVAFSQPYFSDFSSHQNFNTTIYLDNSFSMQAKREKGELLKSISQDILENSASQNKSISILTNTDYYNNLDDKNLKNELVNIKYNPNKLDLNNVLLQLKSYNSNKTNTSHNNIIISDFQNINIENKLDFTNVNSIINLVQVIPNNQNNIFIDSVYIEEKTSEEITLNVQIKSCKNNNLSIPISLFEDSKLIGKATLKFDNSNFNIVKFTIPNTSNFNGKISLIDDVLEFDNDFYFSISKPSKINVLSIGKKARFLEKIYSKNEFNFSTTPLQNLNYNSIQKQHIIILNEIENIPIELINSLVEFSNKGGDLVIIPFEKITLNSYNQLLKLLEIGTIQFKNENEHQITSINYDHPLINDVFEKKVTNFQYPKTKFYYQLNFSNTSSILKFDNNQPFISSSKIKNSTIYWVASPLNTNVSNFTESSLVVPVFYNFAKHSLKSSELFYAIQPNLKIEVQTSIGKDEVLKISNEETEFIPLQNISQNKVEIDFQNNILNSGFYKILSNDKVLKTIAFNYKRNESDLSYSNLKTLTSNQKNTSILTSVDEVFEEINNQQKINWLFKWFLAFSVLFLLIEMLILKYFKI